MISAMVTARIHNVEIVVERTMSGSASPSELSEYSAQSRLGFVSRSRAHCAPRRCAAVTARAAPRHRPGTWAHPRCWPRRCRAPLTARDPTQAGGRPSAQMRRSSSRTSSELWYSNCSIPSSRAQHPQHLPARPRLTEAAGGGGEALPQPFQVHIGARGLRKGADGQHHMGDLLQLLGHVRRDGNHQLRRRPAPAAPSGLSVSASGSTPPNRM